MADDPYAHHPELRSLIKDPETSRFRHFSLETIENLMKEHGLESGWWFSDAEREALRTAFLSTLPDGDLWVFAYGSLMTDPALRFAEVRRATLPGHARRFILKDVYGGRGTPETPGLMAALDTASPGALCEGLAFRIDAALVDAETRVLWQRELIAPGYHAIMAPALIDGAEVSALAFLADHDSTMIDGTLSHEDQVRMLATGTGFFGSSLEYLENIARQFDALGIHDPEVAGLLAEVRARVAAAL